MAPAPCVLQLPTLALVRRECCSSLDNAMPHRATPGLNDRVFPPRVYRLGATRRPDLRLANGLAPQSLMN